MQISKSRPVVSFAVTTMSIFRCPHRAQRITRARYRSGWY